MVNNVSRKFDLKQDRQTDATERITTPHLPVIIRNVLLHTNVVSIFVVL